MTPSRSRPSSGAGTTRKKGEGAGGKVVTWSPAAAVSPAPVGKTWRVDGVGLLDGVGGPVLSRGRARFEPVQEARKNRRHAHEHTHRPSWTRARITIAGLVEGQRRRGTPSRTAKMTNSKTGPEHSGRREQPT